MGDGTNSLERRAERLEERAGAREGAGCGLWAIRLWAMGQTCWSEVGGRYAAKEKKGDRYFILYY
jgi:hypothetical protein